MTNHKFDNLSATQQQQQRSISLSDVGFINEKNKNNIHTQRNKIEKERK